MKENVNPQELTYHRYVIHILAILAAMLLCLVSVSQCDAQAVLYNDGGTLHTDANSILYIEGDIQNKSTAKIENDGIIELAGDLTNDSTAQMVNGSDNSSTERLYKFIGGGTQAIKGDLSDATNRYIYNMVVDKGSSSSIVQLQANTYVTGSLVFGSATTGADTYTPTALSSITNNAGQGIIQTFDGSNNDYELFVTNPSENAVMGYAPLTINGAPADGFIQNRGAQGVGIGGFSRNVTNEGAAYVFPVGSTLNGYNAAALTFSYLGAHPDKIRNMFVDATGGMGTLRQSCVGCGGLTPDNNGFNYYFNSDPCHGNTPQWVILDAMPTDHGYWSFNGTMTDQYFIETYPNSFPAFNGSSADSWRMIKKSGDITAVPTGDWEPEILTSISSPTDLLTYNRNSGCYSGAGVPGGTFHGFSHFQMARTQTNNALPIELLYIAAQGIDNQFIRVTWATSLELNNKGFMIMRSTNGVTFEQIGWLDSRTGGNSTTETDYVYNDNNAAPNVVYYYKLNQVDFDGNSKETQVVSASLKDDNNLTVTEFFPNPATESTSVIINASSATKFNVELYNMTGQLLMQNELNAAGGSSRFNFATGMLPQGTYKAVLKSDKQVFTRSLNIIK